MSAKNQNTLYTGDNLYILNGMNSESVDLIYLDPPFNSKRFYSAPVGSDAAGASFKDMWTWYDVDELCLHKMIDEYPYLVRLIESVGGIHGKAMMAYLTYMTQRIIELHRILKKTGSIYLHCDPTACHYLKLVMDRVFGKDNFRNEIIWERIKGAGKTSQYGARTYGSSSDTILYYTKSKEYVFNSSKIAIEYADIEKSFPFSDSVGRYKRRSPFRPPGLGARPNLVYEYKGINPPHPSGWTVNKDKLKELDKAGELDWLSNNKFYRKQRPAAGIVPNNIWTDIELPSKTERTGFPTQKPLALLRRIIEASSNEQDIVLDPFCGCATTCVAAQQMHRQWIGIDIEAQAADILIDRLSGDAKLFKNFIHRTDIPKRTDIAITAPSLTIKESLFKNQNEKCNGCATKFEMRNLEIDHIIPKSKGGGDYEENYQLLCSNCNRVKGNKPMEYLRMRIQRRKEMMKSYITFGDN